jgi:hypothetical protein
MKTKNILAIFTLAMGLAGAGPLSAQTNIAAETSSSGQTNLNIQTNSSTEISLGAETSPWSFDASLYGVAAGMSGDMTVKGIPVDLNVGFDTVLSHLKFGAMGTAKVGYDRWSLSVDVIYMDLGASQGPVTAEMQQSLVQPMLGFKLCNYFELTAGARYNNLNAVIQGNLPPFGRFYSSSGNVAWWDPVIGARGRVPLFRKFSFDYMGDVGGFGAGSALTWQAEPLLNWQFTKWGSIQAGYRWLYTDYSQGSGRSQFRYNVLTQGPQVGFTLHF